jgi:hypothetical protein
MCIAGVGEAGPVAIVGAAGRGGAGGFDVASGGADLGVADDWGGGRELARVEQRCERGKISHAPDSPAAPSRSKNLPPAIAGPRRYDAACLLSMNARPKRCRWRSESAHKRRRPKIWHETCRRWPATPPRCAISSQGQPDSSLSTPSAAVGGGRRPAFTGKCQADTLDDRLRRRAALTASPSARLPAHRRHLCRSGCLA